MEGRIQELDLLLRNVELIDDPAQARPEVVILGSTVEVVDLQTNEKVIYTIVGPVEVDLAKGRISHLSPVGSALLGRAPGDTLRVSVPAGTLQLRVTRIR